MTNREQAFIATTRKQNILSIGIGDEELIWMISELAYTMHGVCDNDYGKILKLKEKGFKSNETQTFYNCDYKELPSGSRYEAVSFNIKGVEAFREVAPYIKNFLVPEGVFIMNFQGNQESSEIKKICSDNGLSVNWIRLQDSLGPVVSYKAPLKNKWVSVIKK